MSRILAETSEQWASACSKAFVPLQVRSASERFTASLEQTKLSQDVSVTKVVSEASEVYRNSTLVKTYERDDILLSLQRTGVGDIMQHQRSVSLLRGQAAIYDASSPYSLKFSSEMSEIVVQVPRRLIPRTGHAFEDLTARALPSSVSLVTLTNLICSLDPTNVGTGNTFVGEHLAEAIMSLLKAALLSTDDSERTESHAAILHVAFCGYIKQNLSEPDLGVARIAFAHHASERLVHKVFAAEGDTPAGFIRRARLENARILLREGHGVARASYRVGFSNPDTFTKAYKRHYGLLPSEDSQP